MSYGNLQIEEDGLVSYSFPAERGVADILFDLKPRRSGTLRGFVQSSRQRLDFSQFVYP